MSDAPKRLDLAEDPMGGWWSAADAPPEARVTYVLASIADEHKRQRDRLLEAVRDVWQQCASHDPQVEAFAPNAVLMADIRAVIAACQEKGDPT